MSWDLTIIHMYGIPDNEYNLKFKKSILDELTNGDNPLEMFERGENIEGMHWDKYPDVKIEFADQYFIGVPIELPGGKWDKVTFINKEMDRQIQAFFEDLYDDVHPNFAENHAYEIFYSFDEDNTFFLLDKD